MRQTRPSLLLRQVFTQTLACGIGHISQRRIRNADVAFFVEGIQHHMAETRNGMHPEDLMKPDLFSEILLLVSAEVIFALLLLITVTALSRG